MLVRSTQRLFPSADGLNYTRREQSYALNPLFAYICYSEIPIV